MSKSHEASLEELKARLGTFVKAMKEEKDIWSQVVPVGHAVALHDGYTIELTIVRYKDTADYFAALTASRGQGEEPLAVMDLDFTLDWVADSEQVTQEVAAGVAERPGILKNLLADAIYNELKLKMAMLDAANGSPLTN